jgi:release factor glutamine methyltransferase
MPQTIHQLLHQLPNDFDKSEAELLIAHVLKKPREFFLTHPEFKIGRLRNWKILKLIKKRKQGIPLAYLTGHKEFFGLDFEVNKHTLIPRPETEIMVDEVLDEIKRLKNYKITLIDIGTGSGCIPVAIANQIRKSGLSVIRNSYAIDISRRALRVARKNAKKHDVKINFLHGNLLSPILKSEIINHQSEIIITANLPYITEEQFRNEPSIQHEPKNALVTENNGLDLYEKLLKQIAKYQISDIECFFEIGPNQSQLITELIKKHLPQVDIQIKKDLSGLNRVVTVKTHLGASRD